MASPSASFGGALWLLLARLPGGVRVSQSHEYEGLDRAECGVDAYADEVRGGSGAMDAPLGIAKSLG